MVRVRKSQGALNLDDIASQLADTFAGTDTNDDNRISLGEARATYPAHTNAEFAELDSNSNGFLSLAELQARIEEPSGCNLNAKFRGSLGELFLLGLAFSGCLALAGLTRQY